VRIRYPKVSPFHQEGSSRFFLSPKNKQQSGALVSTMPILRLGAVKDVQRFKDHLDALGQKIPCDALLVSGKESPFCQPLERGGYKFGNRIAVQPMEGWDGLADGNPSEYTLRRWKRFGNSGASLIWGGEAVAVAHDGRANPNQLVIAPHTQAGLAKLRETLLESYRETTRGAAPPLVGLQLTHSGRYCRPNTHDRPEPKILYHHPILDRKLGLAADFAVLTDEQIAGIVEDFHRAARAAWNLGFDFVDVKHCHGYLGHEFLSAHTRPGKYGGSFENRTRFLREIVAGIHSNAPGLKIAVRLSAFDTVPFRPDPQTTTPGKMGAGIPESGAELVPYQWGFGVNAANPTEMDLAETKQFLALLERLEIRLVNLTAGSPYYNPHIQRPAFYPPSDGYQPPEDPLVGVARQMEMVRELKAQFPEMLIVGTAYSYLQDFLPHVAQAAIREGWVDFVGLGRMILSYPGLLLDAAEGRTLQHRLVCRTFSDCTTAPRKGLPSGCYPLDEFYKTSGLAEKLKLAKARRA
jgi:NADPH2 dehydrogenase